MPNRVVVSLEPLGREIPAERGAALEDLLYEYGIEFPCGGRGSCGGCRVRVVHGELPITDADEIAFERSELDQGWRLACRAHLAGDVTLEVAQWETIVLADHAALSLRGAAGRSVVVDLGTTTLVAQLVDPASGDVLAVRSGLNPQAAHGADIVSRLHFASTEEGRALLVRAIRVELGRMIAELVASTDAPATPLESVVLVGNTVMHHLFCDLDPAPLSRWPFASEHSGLQERLASALGWVLPGDPVARFLPCPGAFVGSDLLAGLLAIGIHERDEIVALVDLGTNGEIAIGTRDRILCTSTAAGPAFEGGKIRMGMRATTGAIDRVWIEEGSLRSHVIGDAVPRGLCGSGLVDAVAAALEIGAIAPSGRLTAVGTPLEICASVVLTQADVRELQLAKAAIAAGIELLCTSLGAAREDLSRIYLAGAFGNYVSPPSARRIGLLEFPEDRIEAAGNTALLGAKIALLTDESQPSHWRHVLARTEHVSLAEDSRFQEVFIEKTAFPAK